MRKNRKQLTKTRKEIILSLLEENWSVIDIARVLHISRQQVYNILKKDEINLTNKKK